VEKTARRFDVTIIGSGPAGYVAAIRAAQLGLKTAVVEIAPLPGGTCLHRGCIPTKALLKAAEVLEIARRAAAFGVRIPEAKPDLAEVHRYKDEVVRANAKGIEYLFRKNEVELIRGRGRLAGPGRVEVAPVEGGPAVSIETRAVVLATGSVVRELPGVPFDGERILSSDHALNLERVPSSMIVVGAGAVGVEFASIYASFGSKVTLVEMLPRIVPLEDAAVSAELARAFRRRGIAVHAGTRVEEVTRDESGVKLLAVANGKKLELEAEVLLVAVGRAPLTSDLGLEGTRVRLDRGYVEVDAAMRTAEPGVYAVGDVLKSPALAHLASHEGIVAVEDIAGQNPAPIHYDRVPSCTYCAPEIGSIGLTEEEARRRGHELVVGSFPFSAVARARIENDTTGFVKIVAEKKYDEVLGVHIIGPHATELIAEAGAVLELEGTAEALFRAMHAHPTLSEAVGEAARAVHGRPIHL
jgi:dihydrolipoamide dehydrogenase